MNAAVIYCIDSSALIDLRLIYPRGTFPSLWKKLSQLVKDGRLIAPREVWREVKRDDEIPAWVKVEDNGRMFLKQTAASIRIAVDIVSRFPGLVDPDKETADADPFVVALAKSRHEEGQDLFASQRHVVLTSEKAKPHGKPKIPDVCAAYEVECLSGSRALTDFFAQESWVF